MPVCSVPMMCLIYTKYKHLPRSTSLYSLFYSLFLAVVAFLLFILRLLEFSASRLAHNQRQYFVIAKISVSIFRLFVISFFSYIIYNIHSYVARILNINNTQTRIHA